MITIIDYGMGNVGSIKNMLSKLGAESVITSDPIAIESADKLILPGVGSFDKAIENITNYDLVKVLNAAVLERKVPILGICLGMQLFTNKSEEGTLPGLGWIDAETIRFKFDDSSVKTQIPHMGWNTLNFVRDHPLIKDMYEDPRFYFVHSYHVSCNRSENVLSTTTYGVEFHSAICRDNIVGVQFHPEKSHKYGLKLLENFVKVF